MPAIECTLLTDGSSDRTLIPILEWVWATSARIGDARFTWADLQRLPRAPRTTADRIVAAIDLYPCHVLFVHRDAEGRSPEQRHTEVRTAMAAIGQDGQDIPHICIVPVRMTEAWLLLEEHAIRHAAGNPNGTTPLALPAPNRIEDIPDPKAVLRGLLRTASERRGRRLKKFDASYCVTLITTHMQDFGCLRALPAFRRLVADVEAIAAGMGRR